MHGVLLRRVVLIFASLQGASTALDDAGDPLCPRSLSVPMLDVGGIKKFENGSVLYEGRIYPPEEYWWSTDEEVMMGCVCNLGVTCLRKCCQDRQALDSANCVDVKDNNNEKDLPPLEIPQENLSPDLGNGSIKLEEHFFIIKNRICPANVFLLEPEITPVDEFLLDANGTLTTEELTLSPDRFCMDWKIDNHKEIVVVVCFVPEIIPVATAQLEMKLYPFGMIISIPFMIATLVVYAIIPEIRNLYGKTLMSYVSCLIVAYTFLAVLQLADYDQLTCVLFTFTIYFSFLASFFWLNVMCFDIWWTFGGFRSLQGSVKQRERKKFILYSIYAWGCAILLTVICIIMDCVPGIPESMIRPEFGVERCWFKTESAKALYFYGPMGITVFCNIVLFISTAIKIVQHKKDTAHHLKGTDSMRHDDNKQWFNLYLKLFIVMGINWSMEIVSWLFKGPKAIWYITDLGNALQGVIIFIIFVCKEKIKRLLIKRFGGRNNFLSRDSTRSAYHSSTSRTCTTSIPLHEKTSVYPDPLTKNTRQSYDDSDGA